MIKCHEEKSLMLYGPSGTGKIALARIIMNKLRLKYVFVRVKNALKLYDGNIHKSLIFDDIKALNFDHEELINLFDVKDESHIRILYQILTINVPEHFDVDNNAIRRRLKLVYIDDNIVKIEAKTTAENTLTDGNINTQPKR